ncbi:MAG TPA: protein kinase [Vicinamibacterales bacterium]|nr:protein kinase [Vicinamibacterales bacterium]
MTLSAGSNLGPYTVTGPLGRGGMGEVWRARDGRLGRDVAIKALPSEFGGDPDRLVRFEREARVLASLNHANIAAIYGIEQVRGQQFLVLELVEGETLAERIARGAMPLVDAMPLAVQIADAIEAAHEKDIIHRDLKPANIKLTPDGRVKVLDFGLAKAFDGSSSEPNVFNSPTLSLAATAQGVILGTAAYMSPEQARGQAIDRRTDIWAFGCVLYEMLTGRHAFRGEHVSDILASVLAREPEFMDLPPSVPPRLKAALARCLDKNPKRRWQAIGDVRMELEQIAADPTAGVMPTVASTAPRSLTALVSTAVAAAVIAAAVAWTMKPAPPQSRPLVRFDLEGPPPQAFRSTSRPVIALSPDGRYVAYNTISGVLLRPMDTLTPRLVPLTASGAGMLNMVFSPDGEWLAYWSPTTASLQKIPINGGAAVTIAPAPADPFGISWGRDNNILFTQPDGIHRVSANGGTPEVLLAKPGTESVSSPSLLPDGTTILYSMTRGTGATRWDQAEIIAQQPGGDPKTVLRGGSSPVYVPTGHIVYAVGDVLFAVPFDAAALQVTGGPVPIVSGVQRAAGPATDSDAANFGISATGSLVYLNSVTGSAAADTTVGIAGRDGVVKPLALPKGTYRSPRVSPDGRRLAVETVTDSNQNIIWVYDLSGTSAIRRLTEDGNASRPVWSPDGKRIAYGLLANKGGGIFWQLADGSGLPERLTTAEDGVNEVPESFSPDGKVLSFARIQLPASQASWGLFTLRLDTAERKPELFFDLPTSNEFGSAFSPDGKWIAYASNASPVANGQPSAFAIYLQPYPPTGVKYPISQSGGAWPIWSSGGRELLYRLNVGDAGPPKINSVAIATTPAPVFTSEKALPIQGFLPVAFYREYDVLPNGRQMVMVFPATRTAPAAPANTHIHTVLNWTEELKARVPTAAR